VIREHYAAVKALLPATGLQVYMWSVPTSPVFPYVCIWGDLGDESSGGPDGDSLCDTPDVLTFRVRATYAGLTGDALGEVARKVRAALNRKTPVVTGWSPSKLRQSTLMDAQTDFDVTIPNVGHPIFSVDEFLLVSNKL
jgi:hypothetical protein